jgi:hypothetical protein
MALGSTDPLTEMSNRNLPGDKGRPAREADVTAVWETRPLTQLHELLSSVTGIALS